MKTIRMDRRSFLRNLSALSAFGMASRLDLLNLVASAEAQSPADADYKALVCVFMYGGNDGNNTVIPIDTAGYSQYATVRTVASGMPRQRAYSSIVISWTSRRMNAAR